MWRSEVRHASTRACVVWLWRGALVHHRSMCVLEPRALYKREDTRRWWQAVFRIHQQVGHCVEADRPRAVKQLATALFSASH